MKSPFVLGLFVVLFAWCEAGEPIAIIRKEQKVVGEEKTKDYKYVIETANGIYQEEQGIIKYHDNPGYETQLQQGQYQYVSPEGEVIQVQYTADENGFKPVGAHIPTPPPIPKEIQKLLDHLATKKPDPADSIDYDGGNYDGGNGKSGSSKLDDLPFLELPK